MNLKIVLPPHTENPLDENLLRGSGEEYFLQFIAKHFPDRIDNELVQVPFGKLPSKRLQAKSFHERQKENARWKNKTSKGRST